MTESIGVTPNGMKVFKSFNRFAPFKPFKTSERIGSSS
jgi:hypothetical protein